jgi:hypothetical protein
MVRCQGAPTKEADFVDQKRLLAVSKQKWPRGLRGLETEDRDVADPFEPCVSCRAWMPAAQEEKSVSPFQSDLRRRVRNSDFFDDQAEMSGMSPKNAHA